MLNKELLLLDLDPNVDAGEELKIRLNLELQNHQAQDIPVTWKNRAYFRLIWNTQHQDPVYGSPNDTARAQTHNA